MRTIGLVTGTVSASPFSDCHDRQRRRPGHCRRIFRKFHYSDKRPYCLASKGVPANPRTTNEGPFGEVIRSTGPLAKANPMRFSTKYQDDETGLNYYGYRYYDPGTGRWLNQDPIQERGGINLYSFNRNNAVGLIDLFGLMHIDCGFLGKQINHMEQIIRSAILSMGEINNNFGSANSMNNLGLGGSAAFGIAAGIGVWQEFAPNVAKTAAPIFNAGKGTLGTISRWGRVARQGTKMWKKRMACQATDLRNADFEVVVKSIMDNGGLEVGNGTLQATVGLYADYNSIPISMNTAEGAAEHENEMGAAMSENTYDTILDLQQQLAIMLAFQQIYCN